MSAPHVSRGQAPSHRMTRFVYEITQLMAKCARRLGTYWYLNLVPKSQLDRAKDFTWRQTQTGRLRGLWCDVGGCHYMHSSLAVIPLPGFMAGL